MTEFYYGLANVVCLVAIIFALSRRKIGFYNPAVFVFAANFFYNFVLFPFGVGYFESLASDYENLYICSLIYSIGVFLGVVLLNDSIRSRVKSSKILEFRFVEPDFKLKNLDKVLICILALIYSFCAIGFGSINPLEFFTLGAAIKYDIQGNGLGLLLVLYNGLLNVCACAYGFKYLDQGSSKKLALIIFLMSVLNLSYFGSKGLLLFPIYALFIIRAHYYGRSSNLILLLFVLGLAAIVPFLDMLRFDREVGTDLIDSLSFNLLRRVWDNAYVANYVLDNSDVFSDLSPLGIFIEQFLPRPLFEAKSYPFEAVVTERVMGGAYGSGFIWKADIGGIPEFYLYMGFFGVFVLGLLNAALLGLYANWFHFLKEKKLTTGYIIALFSIGGYSAFNIGISAKLLDMVFHAVLALLPFLALKITSQAFKACANSDKCLEGKPVDCR